MSSCWVFSRKLGSGPFEKRTQKLWLLNPRQRDRSFCFFFQKDGLGFPNEAGFRHAGSAAPALRQRFAPEGGLAITVDADLGCGDAVAHELGLDVLGAADGKALIVDGGAGQVGVPVHFDTCRGAGGAWAAWATIWRARAVRSARSQSEEHEVGAGGLRARVCGERGNPRSAGAMAAGRRRRRKARARYRGSLLLVIALLAKRLIDFSRC